MASLGFCRHTATPAGFGLCPTAHAPNGGDAVVDLVIGEHLDWGTRVGADRFAEDSDLGGVPSAPSTQIRLTDDLLWWGEVDLQLVQQRLDLGLAQAL